MSGDTPQKIFQCDLYRQFKRCPVDCKQEIQWSSDCYNCQGEINPDCEFCNGSGRINHAGCPRHSARKYERLLPYFFVWRGGNFQVWPDGKGMVYQPIKLRNVFNLLLWWYQSKEEKERKKK